MYVCLSIQPLKRYERFQVMNQSKQKTVICLPFREYPSVSTILFQF